MEVQKLQKQWLANQLFSFVHPNVQWKVSFDMQQSGIVEHFLIASAAEAFDTLLSSALIVCNVHTNCL